MKYINNDLIVLLCRLSFALRSINGYEIPLQQLTSVPGISVHRVPLRYHDLKSPYTLAVSTSIDVENNDKPVPVALPYNFLASQVWPSARTAAIVIEKYMSLQNSSIHTVFCEFGCGPGLPSLTAALCHENCHAIATDIDPLALELVRQAAIEQNASNRVETLTFDLTVNVTTSPIPEADIYVFSDVFENGLVAKGAAQITVRLLKENDHSKIWVFAQSDRAQRELYLKELQQHLQTPSLTWSNSLQPPEVLYKEDRLWLCNIDETNVFYG